MRFYAWKENFAKADPMIVENHPLPMFMCRVLASRGIKDSAAARDFLNASQTLSDPMLMHDMEKAVSIVRCAIDEGKKILVFGDYDCDGITATVMLYEYLEGEGADVCYYIPERLGEGYGLSMQTVEMIISSGIELIITVDNGISAVAEIARAKEAGIEVVVTDHHALPQQLPPADALLNSAFEADDSPSRYLCGAAMAFKLIAALEQQVQGDDVQDLLLEQFGDLTAIATLADVVPLKGENRTITHMGLEILAHTNRPGLQALARNAKANLTACHSDTVSFVLAPRINVTGRIGSVDTAVQLLLTQNEEQAESLAAEIEKLNAERRRIEELISAETEELLRKKPSLLHSRIMTLVGDDWHLGVIGISAARMVDRYRKPCMVISCSDGIARGSARSVEGFSIIDAITACSDKLLKFGGHPMAAGFTLTEENIPSFIAALEEYAAEHYPIMPVQVVRIDATIMPEEITMANVEEMDRLSPFGCENPTPIFLLSGVILQSASPIGNGNHLRLSVLADRYTIPMVYFGTSISQFPFTAGDRIDVACNLGINEYNDQRTVSVRVVNVHPSGWRQGEVLRSAAAFESILRGEETADAPENFTRNDLIGVFRYLRDNSPITVGTDGLYYILRKKLEGYTYFKHLAALQIMRELELMEETQPERFQIKNGDKKVELECSKTYKMLQKG